MQSMVAILIIVKYPVLFNILSPQFKLCVPYRFINFYTVAHLILILMQVGRVTNSCSSLSCVDVLSNQTFCIIKIANFIQLCVSCREKSCWSGNSFLTHSLELPENMKRGVSNKIVFFNEMILFSCMNLEHFPFIGLHLYQASSQCAGHMHRKLCLNEIII